MTLIKPSSRYVTDAGTQSGTWVEEKKAAQDAAVKEARSLIRNPKLQLLVAGRVSLRTTSPSPTLAFSLRSTASSPISWRPMKASSSLPKTSARVNSSAKLLRAPSKIFSARHLDSTGWRLFQQLNLLGQSAPALSLTWT